MADHVTCDQTQNNQKINSFLIPDLPKQRVGLVRLHPSVIDSKDKITMAEASPNQPKFVAPEGLSPEDKAHFEQYGRLPKPVKIKNHKVCSFWLYILLFYSKIF